MSAEGLLLSTSSVSSHEKPRKSPGRDPDESAFPSKLSSPSVPKAFQFSSPNRSINSDRASASSRLSFSDFFLRNFGSSTLIFATKVSTSSCLTSSPASTRSKLPMRTRLHFVCLQFRHWSFWESTLFQECPPQLRLSRSSVGEPGSPRLFSFTVS